MKKKYYKAITVLCAVTLSLTSVNAYAGSYSKGSRGSTVVSIQSKLKQLGFFTYHTATGYYGDITEDAVRKYQAINGLKQTGIVDDELLKSLNIEDSSSLPTSSNLVKKGAIDWFSQVQYIFPRGANATVIDVDTGKSFQIKRTFGTNHADVEALTKSDTEIIKSIWGGFSWTRRAVVVIVDGNVIAGSMTAMPHAGLDSQPAVAYINNRSGGYGYGQNLDSVKGNNMDGHIDIHFLNSKTHGTNVVQKSHQDMVQKAHTYISNSLDL